MYSNIIIEEPAYPIELMYKHFKIHYHEPVTYYYHKQKPSKYLYLEGDAEDLQKLINYLDAENVASVGQSEDETSHLYIQNRETKEMQYNGLLMESDKEFCESKKVKYLHFKYTRAYVVFNADSIKESPSKLRH